jgi:PAS domain S-box-containing protein
MPQLSSQKATVYAVLIFLLTLFLTWFFKNYEVAVGGFLVVIVLTVFIPGRQSTIAAGLASIAVMTALVLIFRNNKDAINALLDDFFFLLVILFTVAIVFYLKRLNQHLTFEKRHMTSLFENATEGIILTNKEGKIILVNPAAEKMFGYNSTELVGNTVEFLIPRQAREKHIELREGYRRSPGNRSMGSGRELFAKRKGDIEFPVEISLSHYQDRNEMFVIAFIVDITHRKEVEKNLIQQQKQLEKVSNDIRKLNAELEGKVEERTLILKEALQKLEESQEELSDALDNERELNEIKGRFVSMASHEFRTPLSTVLSSASLLAKYTTAEDQANRNRHIEKIKSSVKHLNDILEDFLSLGKLDEGKVEAQPYEFDLKEFIQETVDEMKGLLKKGQHVLMEHSGNTKAHSDKKLLKNIIINLISNAIKFSPENSAIELKSNADDDFTQINITDHGIGISEEDQEHLFTSFFRGANAANIQGTGLGLHIVKRYADLLNGDVHLQSELNRGTTITLTIPINQR